MSEVSEELKEAMKEIHSIIKKYDIMGTVFLADGLSHGEYASFKESPSWSMVRFIQKNDKTVMHLKAYNKTKKEESNKTINSLYVIRSMMGQMYMSDDKTISEIEKRIDIQKDDGKYIESDDYLK